MKKMMLILVMGMIFCRGIIDAEEVTKSTGTIKKPKLKLLWKKEFDGEVHSFCAFYDGSYVAVAVKPNQKMKYKGGIILLDKEGKKIWEKNENFAVKGFAKKHPWVIVTNYDETRLLDINGKIIWKKKVQGSPIISPNDKYIATIHTGIEGVTPRGLTVFDIKGNKLWNYNPMKFLNAQFLSDEKIILISVDIYGGAFYESSILKKVDKTKGDVIIFESKNGEVVYRDKIEVPFPVYEIKNIDLIKGNIVKVDFGEDGKLLIALKENIIVNTKNIGCKSYWSNGWPIEMKSIVIRRDKDNKKELLFYRKLR